MLVHSGKIGIFDFEVTKGHLVYNVSVRLDGKYVYSQYYEGGNKESVITLAKKCLDDKVVFEFENEKEYIQTKRLYGNEFYLTTGRDGSKPFKYHLQKDVDDYVIDMLNITIGEQ